MILGECVAVGEWIAIDLSVIDWKMAQTQSVLDKYF